MFTSFPVWNAIVEIVLSQGACHDDEMKKIFKNNELEVTLLGWFCGDCGDG
jgi:hypothetical protein